MVISPKECNFAAIMQDVSNDIAAELAKLHLLTGADLYKTLCLTGFSEKCMKNKSHPKVTFKWSRVFDGLLPALSGVVNHYLIDTAKIITNFE